MNKVLWNTQKFEMTPYLKYFRINNINGVILNRITNVVHTETYWSAKKQHRADNETNSLRLDQALRFEEAIPGTCWWTWQSLCPQRTVKSPKLEGRADSMREIKVTKTSSTLLFPIILLAFRKWGFVVLMVMILLVHSSNSSEVSQFL